MLAEVAYFLAEVAYFLAEVAYLTLTLDARAVDLPPIKRPKHIFPSHVFQMAGMLQDELARLETQSQM